MKKFLLSIFSVLAVAGLQAQTWNFSTLVTLPEPDESPTGKSEIVYEGVTVIDGLTLNAASGKAITIDKGNASMDEYVFSQRLKFGGTGNETSRNVSFEVPGNCIITVYGGSSSGSEERTLVISDGTNELGTMTTLSINKLTVTYNGEAGTIYVYSQRSGFNIYLIKVESGTSGINDEVVNKNVVSSEYYDITGRKVSENTTGLIMKKLTYDDGTSQVVKTIVRK